MFIYLYSLNMRKPSNMFLKRSGISDSKYIYIYIPYLMDKASGVWRYHFFCLTVDRGNSELHIEHVGHLNFSGHLYGENDLSSRVLSLNQSWVSADFYSWFEAFGMVLTLKLGGNIGGMWNNQLSTASMTSVPSHSEMLLFFFGYPKVSEHVAFLCFFFCHV